MILTFTPNPCVDKTLFYQAVELGTRPRAERYTCIPGGKGNNVSRAVKALGRETAAFILAGGPPGQHVVQMLEQDDGVPCHAFWLEGMTRTITTILETGQHRQTAFFEPGPAVTPQERAALLERLKHLLPQAKVLTLCGTVPDPKLQDLYAELITAAKSAGVITVLDTHGEEFRLGLKAAPYMVKPNREEAAQLLGRPLKAEQDLIEALQHFHALGVELVVISLGGDGLIASRGSECLRVRPPRIQELNPVGSGDALVAGFAIGLLEGWPLEQMARLGAAAGTANATSWDIGHFTREEVARFEKQITIERLTP